MYTYKQCSRPKDMGCGMKYHPKEKGYDSEYCECGSLLLLMVEKITEVGEDILDALDVASDDKNVSESCLGETSLDIVPEGVSATVSVESTQVQSMDLQTKEIFTVDSRGYIHFLEGNVEESLNEDKVVIYKGGVMYKEVPLIYDEMIFGRNSIEFEPDVDLSEIDPDRNTSRKHLMIYKFNDKYYARNLSTKNSLHVGRLAVKQDESIELEDENLIILSRYLVMVFKKKVVGRNTM